MADRMGYSLRENVAKLERGERRALGPIVALLEILDREDAR